MKRFFFISIILCLLVGCDTSQQINNETVDSLDITKYLGEWHEIARFDNWFERARTTLTASSSPPTLRTFWVPACSTSATVPSVGAA